MHKQTAKVRSFINFVAMARGKYHEDEIARRKEHLKANHLRGFIVFWLWRVWEIVAVFQPKKVQNDVHSFFSSMGTTGLRGQGCAIFWLERWRAMIHIEYGGPCHGRAPLCCCSPDGWTHSRGDEERSLGQEVKGFALRPPKNSKFRLKMRQLKQLKHRSYN